MDNRTRADRSRIIKTVITVIYACLTLYLVFCHETWADEAQPWLMAQELNLCGLLREASAKGHPYLLYLLVFPFAKAGAGIIILKILCWLSAVAAAAILCFYAPFSIWLKILMLSGAPFLYFFPVISRSYSLIPMLLFTAAAVYPGIYGDKIKKGFFFLYITVAVLIGQTHLVMTGLAYIMLAESVMIIKKYSCSFSSVEKTAAVSAAAAGFILPLCQIIYGINLNNSFAPYPFYTLIYHPVIFFFAGFFTPFIPGFISDRFLPGAGSSAGIYDPSYGTLIAALSAVICIAAVLVLLKKLSRKYFVFCVLTLLSQLGIYMFVYPVVFPTRIHCFTISLIFFFWCALSRVNTDGKEYKGPFRVSFCVFLALLVPDGLWFALKDITQPFSSAREMAVVLKENLPEDIPVYIQNDVAEALVYELGKRPLLYNGGTPLKYSRLNEPVLESGEGTVWPKDGFYLVSMTETDSGSCLYKTRPAIKRGETFCLSYYGRNNEKGI
ncbi:MAG: hypothetical protein J6Z08_04670 [Elusimicrobiales bacterium]|nr:hypothetical protein [Elusimicrobiales bacterium]